MGYDAEFSYVPNDILTKTAFYEHVLSNVQALLDDATEADARRKTNWVSALSSVSSVLYNSYADFERGSHGFGHTNRVNWTGFYVIPSIYPASSKAMPTHHEDPSELLVGPYHGRPGCLRIPLKLKRKGVCAAAFLQRQTVTVQDVHSVPGHIACDGTTQSEIVVPVILPPDNQDGQSIAVAVLDLDCQTTNAWSDEDKAGLEAIVAWLTRKDGAVDWAT